MVGDALKYLLSGFVNNGYNPQYEISQIVGNNVFPNVLPQNYGTPALVYTITNTEPYNIKSVRALGNVIDIDIDIVDDSYDVVNQLTTLIINNLHRYNNTFDSNDSDSIGYGTPIGVNSFGMYAPASKGSIQYVGGLQIIDMYYINSVESFDDILETYRNTINFKLTYINDLDSLEADLFFNLNDLNLMATSVGGSDNPLYTQPITIGQGVNYLFPPSNLIDSDNTSTSTMNGIYEPFNDISGVSNTNRPLLLQSALNPPKLNKLNYLNFGLNKFLTSLQSVNRLDRKYKKLTFFSVFTLPDSYTSDKSSCFIFKNSSTSATSGGIGIKTSVSGAGVTLACTFVFFGMVIEDDGSGGETHKGFGLSSIVSWALFGLNPNMRFSDPVYFSISINRDSSSLISGQWDFITSSDFTEKGDDNNFQNWFQASTTTYKDYMFNFETLHTNVTSFNTNGAGTLDLNDEINIYDLAIIPDDLEFGSTQYMEIKKNIITKHNMLNRITN